MTTNFAIIANEPTPYRVHLHRRVAREITGCQLHSVFTGPRGQTTMPWDVTEIEEIRPVWFEEAIPLHGQTLGQAYRLYHTIRDYILKNHIELIILNGYGDLARILLIRWAYWARIPLWVRGDSNIFDDADKGWGKRCIKSSLIRWVSKRVTGIMPMGAAGRAYFRFYGGFDPQSLLCPYEPDYSLWAKPDAARQSVLHQSSTFGQNRRRLLYSGRLVSVKRVDVLLDAFASIAVARPEWDLIIAGDGPLRTQLEQRVPHGLSHRIHWLGFCQAEDLSAIYHSCHVLAHPAAKEPWGLIINEATAVGLPIVTTEGVGAAIELVRHGINGMVVRPGDMPAFARALREVTADGIWQAMSAQARPVLEQWRQSADPVQAIREALSQLED